MSNKEIWLLESHQGKLGCGAPGTESGLYVERKCWVVGWRERIKTRDKNTVALECSGQINPRPLCVPTNSSGEQTEASRSPLMEANSDRYCRSLTNVSCQVLC